MNKIKQFIINSIMKYPTLYLKNDYETSELFVLDHMYFTNGNGLIGIKKDIYKQQILLQNMLMITKNFQTILLQILVKSVIMNM